MYIKHISPVRDKKMVTVKMLREGRRAEQKLYCNSLWESTRFVDTGCVYKVGGRVENMKQQRCPCGKYGVPYQHEGICGAVRGNAPQAPSAPHRVGTLASYGRELPATDFAGMGEQAAQLSRSAPEPVDEAGETTGNVSDDTMSAEDLRTWWELSYPSGAHDGMVNYQNLSDFVAQVGENVPAEKIVEFVSDCDPIRAPVNVLNRILEKNLDVQVGVLDGLLQKSFDSAPPEAEKLCVHKNAPERFIVRHYRTVYLSRRRDRITDAYASNRNTPGWILEEIAEDGAWDPDVEYSLLRGRYTPPRILTKIFRRRFLLTVLGMIRKFMRKDSERYPLYNISYFRWSMGKALEAFARNPHTPEAVLLKLSKRGQARARIYGGVQVGKRILRKVGFKFSRWNTFEPVSRSNRSILASVCSHPAASEDMLENIRRIPDRRTKHIATTALEGRRVRSR